MSEAAWIKPTIQARISNRSSIVQASSNSGNLWNGMRQTFSLGCGSWGGNSVNHNITWRDLINETWVSKPLAKTKEIPSDEELFGKVMGKL